MTTTKKTVLISGASRGIGKGLCEEALRRGYRVYAIVREASRAPEGTEAFVADVRDRKRMAELLHQIAGDVDLYIANAGMAEHHNPAKEESAEKAYDVLDLNASATVYSMYRLSYEWISRGLRDRRIAAVASLAAGRGMPRTSPYSASKIALVSVCQGLLHDLKPHGIGVTAILPGFIDTDMSRELKQRPFLMTVEESAKLIFDELEAGSEWIAFPKRLAALSWFRDRMPMGMYHWMLDRMSAKKVF